MENFIDISIDEIKIPIISRYFYKNPNYPVPRIGKVILFYKYLCRHKAFASINLEKMHDIVKSLERSCFSDTIKKSRENDLINRWDNEEFEDLYHYICGRVIVYLDYKETVVENVNKIINSLINENGYAKKFPTLTHKDIYPELYKSIIERQTAGDQKKIKYSKLYPCPKCKKSLSTISNRYNRSLDEGMSLTITCVYCGFERCG